MPAQPEDHAAGREVRALDVPHQARGLDVRVVDVGDRGRDRLAQVVRRDVRGHADRDAARAVDEQVREARRQDDRLVVLAVVVGLEVDRVGVEVAQHLARDRGQPRLGVVADEAVGEERMVRRVDAQRVDRLDAGRLDRGDLGVVVVPRDQRLDHRTHLVVGDARADPGPVALPALDPVDVVAAQPVALRVALGALCADVGARRTGRGRGSAHGCLPARRATRAAACAAWRPGSRRDARTGARRAGW